MATIDFKAKTIGVYSIHRKTGKSTVARELAGYYQLSGKKTLLVDLTFGETSLMSMLNGIHVPNLYDWVIDIDKKLKKNPWFEISYELDQVDKYIATHPGGLGILSCQPAKYPQTMSGIVNVILAALAKVPCDVIVFDTRSEVREYINRVLSAVQTVLLVIDTYRYDVWEAKHVMERLEEAGCKTSHFKVLFNKKPSFFDDSPPQIAEDLHLEMAGSLPDYPGLGENVLNAFEEYNEAMKKIVEKL